MRIQHKPKDAMQVDWAGNTLDIYDQVIGDISKAYLLIVILGLKNGLPKWLTRNGTGASKTGWHAASGKRILPLLVP